MLLSSKCALYAFERFAHINQRERTRRLVIAGIEERTHGTSRCDTTIMEELRVDCFYTCLCVQLKLSVGEHIIYIPWSAR